MKLRLRWQQWLRVVLLVFAVGFAGLVYTTIRQRTPAPDGAARAPRTDPTAVAETRQGESIVARGTQQDFKVEYDRALTYEDGTARFTDVRVFIPQRQGRDFRLSGREATVSNNQNDVVMEGDVRLATSDGLTAAAARATYQNADGMLRVPGPVTFEKGRLRGAGVGATYDRGRDVLWLLDEARITVGADPATGTGIVDVTSRSAGFARRDRYMRFEGGVRLVRDDTVLEAEAAVAYLAPTEDRLEVLELRGSSSVRTGATGAGALERMTARDINLTYAPDGRTLQHAALAGSAVLQIAGAQGRSGRRLTAEWIDLGVGPDGATLESLAARDRVDLQVPAESAAAPSRRIRAAALEGVGEPGKPLTSVRFLEDVEFTEQRPESASAPAIDRVARSRSLDAVMQPGLGEIDRASFGGGVTFRNGTTSAEAPGAVYDLARGALQLSTEAGGPRARVDDPQVTIEARKIDLALETDAIVATTDVRSVLKAAAASGGAEGARRRPGMLRGDQPVHVTGQALDYQSRTGRAVYTGEARLWQGETAVQGETVTLDDKQGNLTAKGKVRSTWRLEDTDPKSGKTEKKTTVATADDLVYEDALRRAAYAGGARMIGPEGDLRGATIDLFFNEPGDALDRLEAATGVTLQSENKTSTGDRLTYFAVDARYVMQGSPVRVLEQKPTECRETLGKTLTFYRSTDSILVDGNEESRTQTTSGGKCPGPPPGE